MKTNRQEGGRINQKRRTRAAILAAAVNLVADGSAPTVADAADAAEVSRATAYRYFPTQESLLLEVALDATTPEIDQRLAPSLASEDVHERLDAVLRIVTDVMMANEVMFRAMLRTTLEPDGGGRGQSRPLRGGRRIRWIEQALAPLRDQLPDPVHRRLVASLTLLVGIEALIVLRDINDLEPDEVVEVVRWAGQGLLMAALQQATG